MHEAKELRKRFLGQTGEKKESSSKPSHKGSNHKGASKTSGENHRNENVTTNTAKDTGLENSQLSAVHWWGALAFATVLSIGTRLYKIEVPSQIW